MNKPRIGMVGLGGIAQKAYLPILSKATEWTFEGAYSPNAEKRQAICEQYRLKDFGSLSDLAQQCDALFVHSSTESHYEVVSSLLRMGKDVYVDKPLASTLEQAEQLAELSAKLGRKLMVGFNRRFAPLYAKAKEQLDTAAWITIEKHRANAIGPHEVEFTMLDDYLHLLDTVRWLGNSCITMKLGSIQINEQDQMLHAHHHYVAEKGLAITTAMHRHAGTNLEQLEIVKDGAIIRIKNMNILEIEQGEEIQTTLAPSWQSILKQRGFEDAVQYFIKCITENIEPIINGEEAMKSQQMLMNMLNE